MSERAPLPKQAPPPKRAPPPMRPLQTFRGGGGQLTPLTPLVALLHDLVWEIISASEKRMKNCIVKIIDNVFEKKMTKVGYFL